nr:hypothetical protein [Arthrospira sp. PLM2.Bin9]
MSWLSKHVARKHGPEEQVRGLKNWDLAGRDYHGRRSRSISDLGWRQLRTLLPNQANTYGVGSEKPALLVGGARSVGLGNDFKTPRE